MHGSGDSVPGLEQINVLLSYYPRTRGGPFVEGGAGYSYYRLGTHTADIVEPIDHGSPYYYGRGLDLALAIGWEIGHGPVWFTPRLGSAFGDEAGLRTPSGAIVTRTWKQNVFLLELGGRFDLHSI
jgi:hypothetical protein